MLEGKLLFGIVIWIQGEVSNADNKIKRAFQEQDNAGHLGKDSGAEGTYNLRVVKEAEVLLKGRVSSLRC